MNSTAGHALCDEKPNHGNPLSLRRNCSWMALGNAVEMLAQGLRVVVLLHLGGAVMVGSLALAFAVCAPVFALASLDLRGVAATDARRQYRFGDYLALRLATSVLALLAIAAVVLAAGYRGETAMLILLIAVGEVLKGVSDTFHALQQQHERMDRLAISLMIRGSAGVAFLALGVWWTGSLLWAVAALPLVTLVTLLFYDLPNGRRLIRALSSDADPPPRTTGLKPCWEPRTMLRLAWLALPMGVVIMIIALQTSVPRYLVDYYLGKHALGVFVSIWYLAVIGGKVASSISQSAGPRLAKYYAAGNTAAYLRLLGRLALAVAGLGAVTVLGMLLVGRPVLGLLFKPEFARYANLAVCLMAAAAVGYLAHPAAFALIAMRRFKTHMVMRAAGIALLAAAALVCVPRWGLYGIALAILLGSAGCVLGCALTAGWLIRRRTDTPGRTVPVETPLRRAA